MSFNWSLLLVISILSNNFCSLITLYIIDVASEFLSAWFKPGNWYSAHNGKWICVWYPFFAQCIAEYGFDLNTQPAKLVPPIITLSIL